MRRSLAASVAAATCLTASGLALTAPAASAADPSPAWTYYNTTHISPGVTRSISAKCPGGARYVEAAGIIVNRLYPTGPAANYRVTEAQLANYPEKIHFTVAHGTYPPPSTPVNPNFFDISVRIEITCRATPPGTPPHDLPNPSIYSRSTLPPATGTPAVRAMRATCPPTHPVLAGDTATYDGSTVTMGNAQRSAPDETPGWASADFENHDPASNQTVTLTINCRRAA